MHTLALDKQEAKKLKSGKRHLRFWKRGQGGGGGGGKKGGKGASGAGGGGGGPTRQLFRAESRLIGLADKVSGVWICPIEELPVYKDLPRLAKRITVTVEEEREKEKEEEEEEEEEENDGTLVFDVWYHPSLPKSSEDRYVASTWGEMPHAGTLEVCDAEEEEKQLPEEEKLVARTGREKAATIIRAKPLERWTEEDVTTWLQTFYFDELYGKEFKQLGVDGAMLAQMKRDAQLGKTAEWKRKLGMSDPSHWTIFEGAVLRLSKTAGSSEPEPPGHKQMKWIRLYDFESEELVLSTPGVMVYQVIDSSRYFVLRSKAVSSPKLKYSQGIQFIGIAFAFRTDSAAFRKALEVKKKVPTIQNDDLRKSLGRLTAKEIVKVGEGEEQKHPQSCFSIVGDILSKIAQQLESEATYERLQSKIKELHGSALNAEMQYLVAELIEEGVGIHSKTAAVLKAIHQSIIFIAVYEIKARVTGTELMTRDVSTAEGWRISIHISQDSVTVTHYRREQALATAPPNEQFWFEWKLVIVFGRAMEEITAAHLDITQLHFQQPVNPTFQEKVSKLLQQGNMNVC
ncbi:hypothetical protein QOT17_024674 [Balamuthia mandrillaris]